MLRARLFGPLALEVDGLALRPPTGATARSVLAWLLLHPGLQSRTHVAAQFWPDVLDSNARASLRTALWEIRRAVEPAGRSGWLRASRDRVGVPRDLERYVDVEAFERLVRSAEAPQLEEALALSRRPLLTDLADDWVLERRDELRDRAVAAALELAGRAEVDGDHEGAVAWSRRAAAESPLDEHVHRELMRRLDVAGRRADALVAFDRLEAALTAQVGTEPSAPTRALADRMRHRSARSDRARIIEESATCRAPALEVWKLLQDPLRYPEWWDGLVDTQVGPDGVTRWMGALPGVPIPTRVEIRRGRQGVVIRCEVTGIVHVWTLEPAPGGCRVRLRAAVPAQESERWLDQQRGEARASLPRLVRAAERTAGAAVP